MHSGAIPLFLRTTVISSLVHIQQVVRDFLSKQGFFWLSKEVWCHSPEIWVQLRPEPTSVAVLDSLISGWLHSSHRRHIAHRSLVIFLSCGFFLCSLVCDFYMDALWHQQLQRYLLMLWFNSARACVKVILNFFGDLSINEMELAFWIW